MSVVTQVPFHLSPSPLGTPAAPPRHHQMVLAPNLKPASAFIPRPSAWANRGQQVLFLDSSLSHTGHPYLLFKTEVIPAGRGGLPHGARSSAGQSCHRQLCRDTQPQQSHHHGVGEWGSLGKSRPRPWAGMEAVFPVGSGVSPSPFPGSSCCDKKEGMSLLVMQCEADRQRPHQGKNSFSRLPHFSAC